MRELTVWIRFQRHSLGNVKSRDGDGRFTFARSPAGQIIFMPSWHQSNMRLASQLYNRHQSTVDKIFWDLSVEHDPARRDRWYRRYYQDGGRKKYIMHEAFFPGDVVGIKCAVPSEITDDDLAALLNLAGKYKGLSPYKPGTFGHFEVDRIVSRWRSPAPTGEHVEDTVDSAG